jgi:hypothetical protein
MDEKEIYHCNCCWWSTTGTDSSFEHCGLMEDLLRNNNMRGSVMVQCQGEFGLCECKCPKEEWFKNKYTLIEMLKRGEK